MVLTRTLKRTLTAAIAAASVLSLALTGCSSGGGGAGGGGDTVELSFLVGNDEATLAQAEALVDAYAKKNPNVKIKIDSRPGGTEGDNIVKTRLSTGDMADVFLYNSGSLFQAINPKQNLLPLTDESYMDNVDSKFYPVVTAGQDKYGVPWGTTVGGGVLYNIPIYKELGLSVPKSWDEFMANNKKIKDAGKTPVIQTYKDSWTAQLFVLADYYNVQKAVPDFAEKYTKNQAKYATTPAALRGFQVQEELFKAGYWNKDFGSATYDDGVRMVATGEGAHYPMLSSAVALLQTTYTDNVNDVGFFAMPGEDAASNGMTVWFPGALYIPKASKHPKEAKEFLGFVASPDGCAAMSKAGGLTGPYVVKGCELPSDVPPIVTDIQKYFQTEGATSPALEFVSPIKGPALSEITVEVGSGIRSAEEGAKLYDEDVRKQAEQLGLEGW
ncbi:hypothetical protein GCM10009841_20840 [Microlunatus panaciterrae]|uniref:Raffinose/stachyose/melibiose transport system substrate-binding protein n=1 Tax=Microlunatus panaciterrae TaxID=400768 RepID=A0ABS2RNP6_9ACTN|nr:ABC transporter substrate-binding protein [Microlunatus panaciterrae]MBM7800636.1 raffinose/stachyose/melibiose transport system substrate-binding protein [Microlunatus panaciterrae]